MKYKATFARIVNEAQLVEELIEADNLGEAQQKHADGAILRHLVTKRDMREVTPVGEPTFVLV